MASSRGAEVTSKILLMQTYLSPGPVKSGASPWSLICALQQKFFPYIGQQSISFSQHEIYGCYRPAYRKKMNQDQLNALKRRSLTCRHTLQSIKKLTIRGCTVYNTLVLLRQWVLSCFIRSDTGNKLDDCRRDRLKRTGPREAAA